MEELAKEQTNNKLIDFNSKKFEKNLEKDTDMYEVETIEVEDVVKLSNTVLNLGTEMLFDEKNTEGLKVEKNGKLGFVIHIFKKKKVYK